MGTLQTVPGLPAPRGTFQPDRGGRCPHADPSPLSFLSTLALEGRHGFQGQAPICGWQCPHSLGVTQSLMYAFSRACMVFTTANSSAMLSYLRGGRVRQAKDTRPPGPGTTPLGASAVAEL